MSTEPHVYVVDDDPALRDAITFLLATRGLKAVAYPSAEAFLDAYSPELRGCLLTDIRMDGMSGLELFDRLSQIGNRLPCIVLTGHGDVPMAVSALKKGVKDFVEKPFDGNTLVDKLLAAIDDDLANAEAYCERQLVSARLETLSERERDVMRLMLSGHPNKVIAAELGIAMRTVEAHRARIFEKMHVRSAVELSSVMSEHAREA